MTKTPRKSSKKPTAKSVSKPADRDEAVSIMEPMTIASDSRWRNDLTELAVELTHQSAAFKASLPDGMLVSLRDVVRNMNCYYSNFIEGHVTHPTAIERALNEVYDEDRKKRDLQLEAKAHISVQRWIDEGGIKGKITAEASVRQVHKRFVERLPEELRWVEDPDSHERFEVIPGAFRDRDVRVGRHIPISPPAIPRFMQRYSEAYDGMGRAQTIISAAAAHHRLVWIHPFLDGNGRVARLISHAMMSEALESAGIWSIARGLARNVEAYKGHLAECDLPRRNDLDGRGALSDEALASFTKFFLETCIDQVGFMRDLLQPDKLRSRILTWADEEMRLSGLSSGAAKILEAILYRGELPRGDIPALLGVADRTAARVTSQLNGFGVITSASSRSPWRLALPATLAHRWLPGLYPVSASQ
jgi:Fic family protein